MRIVSIIFSINLIRTGIIKADSVPVFILDYESVLPHVAAEPNPFFKIDASVFLDIIHETIKNDKTVILFIEETFSTEDISIKDEYGSPYYHLKQGMIDGKVKYLPKVVEPYKTLKQVFQHQKQNVFHISSSSNKIQVHNGRQKHFYVYFKDYYNETRSNALRRHDIIMNEVYLIIKRVASGPVLAFYTGKINSVVRKMKLLPIKPTVVKHTPGITIASTGGLFRLIGVYSTLGSRRSTFSQIPLVAEETWTRRRLYTRMAYADFELEFVFSFKHKGWIIENVALLEWGEEVGRTKLGVGAPMNYSYVCGEPLILVNTRDGSAVIISQYQIQPFHNDHILRNATGDNSHFFGPAIHCGPYFNTQILSGLLVSFLLLGILTYGILVLYNCHSNDRYDDPQGKQLVIVSDGMQ